MKYFLPLLFIVLQLSALDAFISPNILKQNLDKDNLIIIDVSDSELYRQGHIKGAINFDVLTLIDNNKLIPTLKAQDTLEKELLKLGIAADSEVVIYAHNTDKGVSHSTFLALTLISNGFENLTILDGGYMAWIFENELLISTALNTPKDSIFKFYKVKNILVDSAYLENNLLELPVIDSRATDYYYGIKRSEQTKAVGHISYAKSHYYKNNFLTDGLIRNIEELKQMYIAGLELKKNQAVIVYSDDILTASINWYILYKLMGYAKAQVYEASFYEWGNYPKLPITKFRWE